MYLDNSPLLDPYVFYSNRNEYWFYRCPETDALFTDFPEDGKYMIVSGVRMQVFAYLQKSIFLPDKKNPYYYYVYLVG